MPAVLLCALLGAGPGFELGLRLEGRRPTGAVNAPAVELEADPVLAAHTGPGELQATLAYAPRLVFDQVDGQPTTNVMHSLRGTEMLLLAPRTRLVFDEHLSIGRTLFSLLQAAPAEPSATPERLPIAGSLATIDGGGGFTLTSAPTSRLSTSLAAAYVVSGGLDASAQALLPLLHGTSARASVDWAASRQDTLQLAATAAASRSTAGQFAEVYGLTGGWRGRPESLASSDATVGVNYSITGLAGQLQGALSPTASAGLTLTVAERALPSTLSLRGTFTSAVDPITVHVYQRAEARAGLEALALPNLRVAVRGLAGADFGSLSGGFREGEASASLSISPAVTLSAGARLAWLAQALLPPGLQSLQWTAYAGLSAVYGGSF